MQDRRTVTIRDATAGDYPAFARLMPELGVDDPIPSRDHFVRELMARTLVATRGNDVVGYALLEVLADTGYVRNIVSDREHRRAGVGRELMYALRDRFRDAGATTWCLNVKPDNVVAIRLYEDCGLASAYRSSIVRIPATVSLSPPDGTELSAIRPDEDAALETRFGLLGGQLTGSRGRTACQLVKLSRRGEIVGIGVYSSAIPGAFPFRVVEPALGLPFVAHLRTLSPPTPFVQLAVEDDDALTSALLAAGGYQQLEILHMRGRL